MWLVNGRTNWYIVLQSLYSSYPLTIVLVPTPPLEYTPIHTHAGVGHYESVSQLTRVSLNDEVSSVHTCADTSFALTGETHPWSPFFFISSFMCDWFNPQQEAGYTAGATTNMANLVYTQERNRYISDWLTKGGMTACLTVCFVGVRSSCSWLLMFGWTSGFHGNWWSLHCCSDMYV